MKGISSIFKKGEIAFTALESAIVMTAFLVIAVVFSYVIVGAEHSTFETVTTNEVVERSGPSIELAGSVIAKASDSKVNNITAPANSTLQSTEAGDVVNSEFRLEIKPETGEVIPVSSTIPAQIDTVMSLKHTSMD